MHAPISILKGIFLFKYRSTCNNVNESLPPETQTNILSSFCIILKSLHASPTNFNIFFGISGNNVIDGFFVRGEYWELEFGFIGFISVNSSMFCLLRFNSEFWVFFSEGFLLVKMSFFKFSIKFHFIFDFVLYESVIFFVIESMLFSSSFDIGIKSSTSSHIKNHLSFSFSSNKVLNVIFAFPIAFFVNILIFLSSHNSSASFFILFICSSEIKILLSSSIKSGIIILLFSNFISFNHFFFSSSFL